MPRGKRNAWLLTLLFGALFIAAAWPMARRIDAFNRAQHFPHFTIQPVTARRFHVQGFPPASFDDSADASGAFAVKLTYGDPGAGSEPATVFIPVNKPPALNLPDLGIYDEWLRVLFINDVRRDPATGTQAPVPGSERILVVVRRTPEGFAPETWGSVRRTEWVFDFYDLKRDGTVQTFARRWPQPNDLREKEFQDRAAALARGDDRNAPDDRLLKLAAIPPLEERGAEFEAALHVIPKLNVPKYKFTDTAFNPTILGWTLPVCMLSGLGFSFAFFFAVAPRRKKAAVQAAPA